MVDWEKDDRGNAGNAGNIDALQAPDPDEYGHITAWQWFFMGIAALAVFGLCYIGMLMFEAVFGTYGGII
jgi:hypothetical protein